MSAKPGIKILTIRLPEETYDDLSFVAQVDEVSMNAMVFEWIEDLIRQRLADADFTTKVQAMARRQKEIITRRRAGAA